MARQQPSRPRGSKDLGKRSRQSSSSYAATDSSKSEPLKLHHAGQSKVVKPKPKPARPLESYDKPHMSIAVTEKEKEEEKRLMKMGKQQVIAECLAAHRSLYTEGTRIVKQTLINRLIAHQRTLKDSNNEALKTTRNILSSAEKKSASPTHSSSHSSDSDLARELERELERQSDGNTETDFEREFERELPRERELGTDNGAEQEPKAELGRQPRTQAHLLADSPIASRRRKRQRHSSLTSEDFERDFNVEYVSEEEARIGKEFVGILKETTKRLRELCQAQGYSTSRTRFELAGSLVSTYVTDLLGLDDDSDHDSDDEDEDEENIMADSPSESSGKCRQSLPNTNQKPDPKSASSKPVSSPGQVPVELNNSSPSTEFKTPQKSRSLTRPASDSTQTSYIASPTRLVCSTCSAPMPQSSPAQLEPRDVDDDELSINWELEELNEPAPGEMDKYMVGKQHYRRHVVGRAGRYIYARDTPETGVPIAVIYHSKKKYVSHRQLRNIDPNARWWKAHDVSSCDECKTIPILHPNCIPWLAFSGVIANGSLPEEDEDDAE